MPLSQPFADLLRDIRLGARLLLRSPGFTTVAVLSLALGIGANTAIATLINAVMLRPLQVPSPEELQVAEIHTPDGTNNRISYPFYESARASLAGRADLCAATGTARVQIGGFASGEGPGEPGLVQLFSGECFAMLRQRPQLGRLLNPADNRAPTGQPVAVISDSYWARRFDRSPAALGAELRINGVDLRIVGVAARGFTGTTVSGSNPAAWIPLELQPAIHYAQNASATSGSDSRKPWARQSAMSWLNLFVRVPAKTPAPAIAKALEGTLHQDLSTISDYQGEGAGELKKIHLTLASASRGLSSLRDEASKPLLALLAMVGLLLAIACANLAGLLLARASSRQREMAIRGSLGAGRGRLVRQLLAESLLLSLLGGALGLLISDWGLRFLPALLAGNSYPPDLKLGTDLRILLFTLVVSIATGILFGLAPALQCTRVSLEATMRAGSRTTTGASTGSRLSAGGILVAAQMAFSLILLILAGLMARSVGRLARVDVGFDRGHALLVRLDTQSMGLPPERIPALNRGLIERVRALPGVASASLSLFPPLSGSQRTSSFAVDGFEPPPGASPVVQEEVVSDDYFQTLGLRIVAGRAFGPGDTAGGPAVSIINQTMARRYFSGQNPVGRRWGYGAPVGEHGFEIVGVVEDARYNDLRHPIPPMAFRPAAQTEEVLSAIAIRTVGRPESVAQEVRRALAQSFPQLPINEVSTMTERVQRGLGGERTLTYMTGVFSTLALLLACLGLYGTISYNVARRTPELGVRMALGADRGAVLRLVLKAAFSLVGLGLLVGVPLAWGAARGLGSFLYDVPPGDLPSHLAGVLLMVAIAAIAAYLPARRAARLDPTVALQGD